MYGINRPLGLVPYQTLSGDKGVIEIIRDRYEIDPTSQSIGMGAALTLNENGYVTLLPGFSGDANRNSAANKIIGVFQGCTYQLPAANGDILPLQRSEYWTAGTVIAPGTKIFAHLIVDPNVIYTIQTDQGSTGVTRNQALGANGNIKNQTADGRGDMVTPGVLENGTLEKDTDDAPYHHLKVIGADPTGSNDFGTDANKKPYNNVLVIINNHFFAPRSAQNS